MTEFLKTQIQGPHTGWLYEWDGGRVVAPGDVEISSAGSYPDAIGVIVGHERQFEPPKGG
jgi:hypothetical protein